MTRVLIIDDEEIVRFTIEQILRANGYAVDTAENGNVGLSKQRETPFDVVITDIMMPEKDGIETIRALRAEFLKLPVIAISGGGRTGNLNYLDMAKDFGVADTITKPFMPAEITSKLEKALKH